MGALGVSHTGRRPYRHGSACYFCINSLCHMIGSRPTRPVIRVGTAGLPPFSPWAKATTYHHEFQWDYRNGVKPWQLDPSKWFIWTLYKLGLASDLKRVPKEKILLAETRETKRQVTDRITSIQESQNSNEALWTQVLENLEVLSERLTEISNELQTAAHDKINLSRPNFGNQK